MCGSAPPGTGAGRVELAQIFREYGEAYRSTHPLCAQQRRVMQAYAAVLKSIDDNVQALMKANPTMFSFSTLPMAT